MGRVSVPDDEKVLELEGGDGYTTANVPNATKLYITNG